MLREVAGRDARVRLFFPGRLGAARGLQLWYRPGPRRVHRPSGLRRPELSRPAAAPGRRSWMLIPTVGMVGGAYLLVDERRGERYVRMPPARSSRAIVLAMAKYVPIAHTVATFRRRAWSRGRRAIRWSKTRLDFRFDLRCCEARVGSIPTVPGSTGRALCARHQLVPSDRARHTERQRDLARVQAQSGPRVRPPSPDVSLLAALPRVRLRSARA